MSDSRMTTAKKRTFDEMEGSKRKDLSQKVETYYPSDFEGIPSEEEGNGKDLPYSEVLQALKNAIKKLREGITNACETLEDEGYTSDVSSDEGKPESAEFHNASRNIWRLTRVRDEENQVNKQINLAVSIIVVALKCIEKDALAPELLNEVQEAIKGLPQVDGLIPSLKEELALFATPLPASVRPKMSARNIIKFDGLAIKLTMYGFQQNDKNADVDEVMSFKMLKEYCGTEESWNAFAKEYEAQASEMKERIKELEKERDCVFAALKAVMEICVRRCEENETARKHYAALCVKIHRDLFGRDTTASKFLVDVCADEVSALAFRYGPK